MGFQKSFSSSSSFSFSSSTSSNGSYRTGQSFNRTSYSDPSGSQVQTTSQRLGEPAVQETRVFDGEGRQVLEGGRTVGRKRLGEGKREVPEGVGKVLAIEEVVDGEEERR